ncbi:hypothetical protein MettiDRAFT_2641 [Methanolobus tindarius DSM 2278]|uniref:Uncharacterized protein n=1 Tax=Methanolobus tindarius DSM 2278 TaxID=1090322 RepID=W9DZN3_METTI|nr:AAA family ATPase [Methanolobus tindarius]ETA69147.1 hypothetical protein MettiDRAFT_2641 [Methanolobus tindarius DSM 2278]
MDKYRIKNFSIKEFNSYKYLGVKHTKVMSNHLLIYGEHKSGKSTTLDALAYALFGIKASRRPINKIAETCIIITNGTQEIKINRKAGTNHRLEVIDTSTSKITETLTDLEKIDQKICDIFKLPSPDFLEFKTKLLYQDQESSLKRNDDKSIMRIISYYSGLLNKQNDIDLLDRQIQSKEENKQYIEIRIKELEEEKKKQETIVKSSVDEMAYLKKMIESYENESLKDVFEIKEKQREIWDTIVKTQERNTYLNQEKKKLIIEKNELQKYYEEKIIDVLKEIISVLICPVCGKRTNLAKIENKYYNKKCPYCGDDEYDFELDNKIREKIAISKQNIPLIDFKLMDIKKELKDNNLKIEHLKKNSSELDMLFNPEIIRGVEKYKSYDDADFKAHIQDKKQLYLKWIDDLKQIDDEIHRFNTEINAKKSETDTLISEIKQLEDEKKNIEKKYFDTCIDNFLLKLNSYYSQLMGYKKQPIIYKNNKFYLKMKLADKKEEFEDISSSKTIGESEKKCLDIALLLTLNDLDKENNASRIDFVILDEPAEGLKNDSDLPDEIQVLSNLLNLIKIKCEEDETQFIILTADKIYEQVLELPKAQITFNMDITGYS